MSILAQGTSVPSVFTFDSQEIRALNFNGEIWFVAPDVCDALEYRDTFNAVRLLDEDEKGTHILSTLGGDQKITIINESGLYSLILRSRKPEAKRFKKWVTSEVLPSIRKTGRYKAVPLQRITKEQYWELERFIDHWSYSFAFKNCVRHAAWALIRSICGTSAIDMHPDKYPVVLAQFKNIDKRVNKFFILRQRFETQAIKWVFSQGEETPCPSVLRQQKFH